MADLSSAVTFTENALKAIESIKRLGAFSHLDWGGDALLYVRTEARNFYRQEQKGKCAFCKQPVSLQSAANCQVEHIVPKSLHLDFIFVPENLCVVCADCNEIKREQETLGIIPNTLKNQNAKRYPRSSNAFIIVHPHFDIYDDHILIVNGLYVDKGSKKGNFTIGACNLNRKLGVFGWEPEIVDDDRLIEVMNDFISEKDSVKRTKHLNTIKSHLFNI